MLKQLKNKLNFMMLNNFIQCYVCKGYNISCTNVETTSTDDGLLAEDDNYKTATYYCYNCKREHIQGFYAMHPIAWIKEYVKHLFNKE